MLGSNQLTSINLVSRLNQLAYQLNQEKSISDQRKYKREIRDFGQIIDIRKRIDQEKLGEVIKGIIVDYSLGGCDLIIISNEPPNLNDLYQFDATRLDPKLVSVTAEVMWYQQIENDTYRMGLKYVTLV